MIMFGNTEKHIFIVRDFYYPTDNQPNTPLLAEYFSGDCRTETIDSLTDYY